MREKIPLREDSTAFIICHGGFIKELLVYLDEKHSCRMLSKHSTAVVITYSFQDLRTDLREKSPLGEDRTVIVVSHGVFIKEHLVPLAEKCSCRMSSKHNTAVVIISAFRTCAQISKRKSLLEKTALF